MDQNFINHLIELRKRLLWSVAGFVVILCTLLPWSNQLYQALAAPIAKFLPHGTQLVASDITSPFFVPLKLTAMLAFLTSLPNTLYQVWQFISPGLYKTEKKLLISVVFSAFVLFLAGMAFCYFLVLPAIFHFIGQFKSPLITMLTDIDKYLSFVLSLFFIFGMAFETPVIVFLLIRFDILSLAIAQRIRSYVFVGCFIVAAIVTPPDVLSQTLLALPLYCLYELGIITARIFITSSQPVKPFSQDTK